MVKSKLLIKIITWFIKRKKTKENIVLTKSDYENNDILDQLFESNSYE